MRRDCHVVGRRICFAGTVVAMATPSGFPSEKPDHRRNTIIVAADELVLLLQIPAFNSTTEQKNQLSLPHTTYPTSHNV